MAANHRLYIFHKPSESLVKNYVGKNKKVTGILLSGLSHSSWEMAANELFKPYDSSIVPFYLKYTSQALPSLLLAQVIKPKSEAGLGRRLQKGQKITKNMLYRALTAGEHCYYLQAHAIPQTAKFQTKLDQAYNFSSYFGGMCPHRAS